MKKILRCVAIVSVVAFGYSAYAEEEFTPTDTLVADIVRTMQTLSPNKQLNQLEIYEQKISDIEMDPNTKEILLTYIKQKEEDILANLDAQTDIPSTTGNHIKQSSYEVLANTNRNEITQYRLGVHNTERATKGLAPLSYDKDLEMTAHMWSSTVKDLGKSTHKRLKSDPYYSYTSIKDWFANLGVNFDDTGTSFSESIGRGYYKCKSGECTQNAIKAISSTFKFFMSEKSRNGSHYRAIMTPEYTKMGLGISIDPKTKKYFLVTHYSK